MPSKKIRNRAIQSEINIRKFEESLKIFTDEELEKYEYLSTCNADEMNEQECEELIALEKIRANGRA